MVLKKDGNVGSSWATLRRGTRDPFKELLAKDEKERRLAEEEKRLSREVELGSGNIPVGLSGDVIKDPKYFNPDGSMKTEAELRKDGVIQ